MGCSYRELLSAVVERLAEARTDLEDRLSVLNSLYIPTRYPDGIPIGAPTDHFGCMQSADAIGHARALIKTIRLALKLLKAAPGPCANFCGSWSMRPADKN